MSSTSDPAKHTEARVLDTSENDGPHGASLRLLARAVERIGGAPRSGQEQMVGVIDDAVHRGGHALVQAGTGTGKSLGYLAPLVCHLEDHPDQSAVIATATLALQTQLATKDMPTILQAADDLGFAEISWSVLKGSSNYPCLLKIRDAPADPAQRQCSFEDLAEASSVGAEHAVAESSLGEQVLGLRSWAERLVDDGQIADRDDAPGHTPRAWSLIAVSGRECLGQRCPYVSQCFVFAARERAALSQLVVTNHALVAIEAEHGWGTINPDVLVIDEAHELVARVTTSKTDELSPQMVDRAVRMAGGLVSDSLRSDLGGAADRFADTLAQADAGRIGEGPVLDATRDLRNALRQATSGVGREKDDPRKEQVAMVVKQVYDVCDRVATLDDADVVWMSVRPQFGPQLVAAPLRVDSAIRESVLVHQPTILTSATLTLGGSFAPFAASVGLMDEDEPSHVAVDVGSPFDYSAQGICYVAAHLPPPGRDGIHIEALEEIAALLAAAGGHALGLFSSMRAAQRAADHVRDRGENEVLLQGEGHLPDLIARFIAEPDLSLFGTISLWQGVDAPGSTCDLVIVDRIPFPRPDEPLTRARQDDVSRHGGNGFMRVAAAHAGLMLAQGTGRLIRRTTDQGVVAILDPRLLTARYGDFLVASMPPLWMTASRETVLGALSRLRATRSVADQP